MNATPEVKRTPARAAASTVRPLRILHVLDHSLPLHSGYTFRTLAILRQQHALGWETFQLTGPKQGSGVLRDERCGEWLFYRTPPATGWTASAPLIGQRALMRTLQTRLAEVVERVQPDILHAHSPVLNAIPALNIGHARGIPVVYEVRAFWEDAAADHGTAREGGPRYRLTRALETRALRRADAVTTICEGLRADMLARGIAAHKITVIPNAVDVAQFVPVTAPDAALVAQYGLTRGMTLGFAGSFYAYEGLDVLLQAMQRVHAALPQARLLLVGGGPQEQKLRSLARQLGLEPAVHFVGRVPHADVGRYYGAMDVMVYPRIRRRLTDLVTPLKPLEAMAMRKLVVASDVGGHRELIRDRDNGYLFRAGSPDALARCLIDLLQNPGSREQVLDNGRAYVENERTWQVSVARYRDVYAAVLDATRRGGRRMHDR